MIDKLLGRPSCQSAVGQLPLSGLQKQFFLRHIDSAALRQHQHDILELFPGRRAKIDPYPETVYQGQLLLYRVGGVKIVAVHQFQFVSRSEEHTSELQSRFDLVCRLLLEKKKTYIKT